MRNSIQNTFFGEGPTPDAPVQASSQNTHTPHCNCSATSEPWSGLFLESCQGTTEHSSMESTGHKI